MSDEPRPDRLETQIRRAFMVILILQALAAYAVAGIPLPWLAQAASLSLAFYLFALGRLQIPRGLLVLFIFIGFAVGDTFVQSSLQDYAIYLPAKATTSYVVYISLRFIGLMSFTSMLVVAHWLVSRNVRVQLMTDIVRLGVLMSAVAIYIYFAQLHGWWEPARTRVGTSGDQQSVVFSYAFHRAMGTFREPSHLAEWLILPLFLSFATSSRSWISRSLMMITLLLTGSLTGVLAVVGGVFAAVIFSRGSVNLKARGALRFTTPIAIGLVAFSLVAASRSSADFSLAQTLWQRMSPLFEQGVSGSNRSYIYSYLKAQPASLLGSGLGNANLQFSHDVRLEATGSFLNIYVTYLLSLGLIGLMLFGFFLATPIYYHFIQPRAQIELSSFYVFAAYVAWLFLYGMHAEEPSLQFAFLYALANIEFSGPEVKST